MAVRKPLSPKLRFDVFARDRFRCQYCGRGAPEVELEVDHIKPVARGGTDDMRNLITACRDCNRGKGDSEIRATATRREITAVSDLIADATSYELTAEGRRHCGKLIEEYGFMAVYRAAETVTKSGKLHRKTMKKIERICAGRKGWWYWFG